MAKSRTLQRTAFAVTFAFVLALALLFVPGVVAAPAHQMPAPVSMHIVSLTARTFTPAGSAQDPNPLDLYAVLRWLEGVGAAVVSNTLLSALAERCDKFQRLPSYVKRWIGLAASIVVALAAWAALTYVPPEVLKWLAVPFSVAMAAAIAYEATEVFHALTRRPLPVAGGPGG